MNLKQIIRVSKMFVIISRPCVVFSLRSVSLICIMWIFLIFFLFFVLVFNTKKGCLVMDKDRNQKKDKVIESCIKVLDIGAMRQREEFMSSFRKTTSLFVAAVNGFFLASFLFFFFFMWTVSAPWLCTCN